MADPVFHRPDLANELADAILADGALAPARSGLFLAAPRRTGKSTFLREDLMPALENRGAAVLYVDLWADKAMEPGLAIVSLVRAALASEDGAVLKMFRKAGLDKVNVGGLGFDVGKVGLGTGVTLSQALAALSDRVEAPIVLMIDEAQHAATTEGGNNALFALKAARDELNSSAHHGLRIVATGSSRPKLALLRASKDQAFFRAMMRNFPPLDARFVQWFIANTGLPTPLDAARTEAAFRRAAWRPEVLVQALGDLPDDNGAWPPADRLDDAFEAAVAAAIEESDEVMLKVVRALTPLQGAVLRVMGAQGEDYSPYAAATLEAVAGQLARLDPNSSVKPDVPNVQSALEALQVKSLVWRAAHGEYALEEQGLVDLMRSKGLMA
ncbi:MAG: ATP-binding protein [Burkholderiales bacterium]|nr:ATP-binding protein [Burkholderiales bacterium]